MAATETHRTCTAFADVSPFAGGDIMLGDRGRSLRWHPAIGVSVRYKPIADRTYRRAVNTLYQGCQIAAEAFLTLDSVTDERLDGTYRVTYTRRNGSDRCLSIPERCELAFSLEGSRAKSARP